MPLPASLIFCPLRLSGGDLELYGPLHGGLHVDAAAQDGILEGHVHVKVEVSAPPGEPAMGGDGDVEEELLALAGPDADDRAGGDASGDGHLDAPVLPSPGDGDDVL